MALSGSRPNAELVAARFLLKPGRKYEDAVKAFSALRRNQGSLRGRPLFPDEPHPRDALRTKNARVTSTVNNRLEGNALETISAMLTRLESLRPLPDAKPESA